MGVLDGFGQGRWDDAAGSDGGGHVGRIFLEDDGAEARLEGGEGVEAALPVDVLEEQRGEE